MPDFLFSRCALHELHVKGDDRGNLVALEAHGDIPFDIARIYYIFDTSSGVSRGFHAHHRLRQWAICVSGACTISLDDGHARSEVRLDRPTLALEIGPLVWHVMRDFSPACVLLLVADGRYDEADYIRDYEDFVASTRRMET
jgi:dTDP-4-dehydrorhamnose 3,5-epimerase-like enzyme